MRHQLKAPVVDLTRLKPFDSLLTEPRIARSYRVSQSIQRAWLRFSEKMGWRKPSGWCSRKPPRTCRPSRPP